MFFEREFDQGTNVETRMMMTNMFVHVVSSLLLYPDFSPFVSNECLVQIDFSSLSLSRSLSSFLSSSSSPFHMNLPCEQVKTNREASLPSFVFLFRNDANNSFTLA